jgi:hypothetical protein
MPANTTPDNIIYPAGGDNLNPLKSWFAQLATSVQAALTALRAEAVKPALPNPISIKGANVQAITSTAWADLPNITAATLNLTAPAWVQITVGAWATASAGDTRISAAVSGATTLGESQLEVGGDNASWGQVIFTDSTTGSRQSASVRIVRLNAGTNTIKVRAYRNGSGTNQSNYTTLQVTPIRWA